MRQRKKWVRLDNASNIFLAAMSPKDTKVFRFSAEVSETIDSELLQKALDKVYDQYLLYHSVLRRGMFWYYLEESDLRPTVELDTNTSCEALYHFDRRELLFRVVYWKKRINLEVFHVLSDGTGALWFFEDLLKEYLILKHPESQALPNTIEKDYHHEKLVEDSFARHFRKKEQRNFGKAAQSAVRTVSEIGKVAEKVKSPFQPVADKKSHKVYQAKGTKTPDSRPRIVELEMPVKDVIKLAKKEKVSLTLYLIALFMESIRLSATDFRGNETMAVSVPVNLRQFFPSNTARNFFSVTRLEYQYRYDKENTIKEICESLNEQFEPQLSKESLEEWLTRLINFEYHPIGRIVIRPIKDLALKMINKRNNRNLTIAISNLGKVSFSERIDAFVHQVYFHTIAVRPQFCAISHGEVLTISFTSPFVETDIQQKYASLLTVHGIPVTVAVNKVTEEELGGGGL